METDVNHPARGRHVQLIRWVQSASGWTSEVRRGRYLGSDDEVWVIEEDGIELRLPRGEWQRFVADPESQDGRRATEPSDPAVPSTSRPLIEG